MKKLRSILSVLLVVCMLMSMTVMAFAEEPTGGVEVGVAIRTQGAGGVVSGMAGARLQAHRAGVRCGRRAPLTDRPAEG